MWPVEKSGSNMCVLVAVKQYSNTKFVVENSGVGSWINTQLYRCDVTGTRQAFLLLYIITVFCYMYLGKTFLHMFIKYLVKLRPECFLCDPSIRLWSIWLNTRISSFSVFWSMFLPDHRGPCDVTWNYIINM